MELPSTSERVAMHTADWKNRLIQRDMEMRIWYFAQNPGKIDERLRELDQEWDIERALEANAAGLALFGTALGLLGARRFLFIPAVVTGFLMQHALQGWCPPVTILRRFGVRTQAEIESERYALKSLRGDFQPAAEAGEASQRIERTLDAVKTRMPAEARLH